MVNKIHTDCLVIVFSFLFISKLSFPQYYEVKFEHIRVEEGLPINNVNCILQDYIGFLWLGTENGLVKYDGYSMTVYQPGLDDTSSISGSDVRVLCEDHNGNLWVGTKRRGLSRYDRSTDKFTHYINNPNDTSSLNSNLVKNIYVDKAGRLWIGTDKGLNLLNTQMNNFSHYLLENSNSNQHLDTNPKSKKFGAINTIIEEPISGNLLIGSNLPGLWLFDLKINKFSKYESPNYIKELNHTSVKAFHQARDGTIWMGTSYGLGRIDHPNKQINFFKINHSLNYHPVNDFITVLEDRNGLIWVGTYGQGLARFNPKTGKFQRYQYDKWDAYSLYGYRTLSLYEDHSGILWIGIETGGLDRWDKRKWKFVDYRHNSLNPNSLCENWVQSICEDQNGMLWLGTEGGLDQYDRKENVFIHYKHNPLNPNSLSSDSVWSILEDPDNPGVFWIGTPYHGLNKFDSKKRIFTHYRNNPNDINSLSDDRIICMLMDHEGVLWIGTRTGGLNRFDRKTNKFRRYQHIPDDSTSLSENYITVIYEDKKGTLWIGTDREGLNKFDRNTGAFTNYRSIVKGDVACGIFAICEDRRGNFWIGAFYQTFSNGLHLFDREKGISIKHFNKKDGLANNSVEAIIEDDYGNLWLNTINGISKFNPITESFRTYDVSDGLAGVRLNAGIIKSKNGEMFVGSADGFNIFHPDSVKDDPIAPLVVINNVSLFNRPGEKLTFEKFISELDEIKLTYNQNDLRFDFVGLHYSEPRKNVYKYILEGFDDDWIDAGNQRNATYTNLDPGEYIFKCNAANRDGIWNEEGESIKIIILPPWWATTWAYIIYALILVSIIYFTWRLQLKRVRIKHDYEMSKFEAEKMHEVDEMKSRFFANISHEFRTPLTLIFGPAKDVLEKTEERDTKKNVGVIKRNASRLYSLVNQLLDLSKLEAGKMKLEVSEQNIMPLLKGLVLSFTSLAERKKITLQFNTIEENLNVYIDKDKVEKIITNLLSNAFKFTPEGGKVDFTVEKLMNDAEIRITDNGVGIPRERIDKIFDRFYQVDGSHTRESEGTGIGLALTKELVELHKGKIKAESKEEEGTTFTVLLPLGKDHLKSDELVEKEIKKDAEVTVEETEIIPETENRKQKTNIDLMLDTSLSAAKEGKPLLLIVEDNTDVRKYIISHLESDYRIQEAVDGEDGLDKSIEQIPDLIVSDVMMPKMDGFQLCERLKTDERTSHIPVIMLTAKATSRDKIEGYETGADDYIMKPFDAKELKVRIKNLIEQRKMLREHFRKEGLFEINNKTITSTDKKFLKKVSDLINKHISNASFSVDSFADDIGMSRSQLHRKLVALVGEPPSDLIRRIRLSKAAKLIENKFGNISEIALEVGFNNPANFANSFRRQFGLSPSEYKTHLKN